MYRYNPNYNSLWILPFPNGISFLNTPIARERFPNGETQFEGPRPVAFGAATGQIARKWPKTGSTKRALFGITQPRSHLGGSPHPHSFKCGGPRAKGAEREYYEITPSSSLPLSLPLVRTQSLLCNARETFPAASWL